MLDRRSFCACLAASGWASAALARQNKDKASITGRADPHLAPFDELMTSFIRDNKVPGASLAITRAGKLVYARGFGYANIEKKVGVQPAHLFRIASVSKPISAVAVYQLVEQKKLKLDDHVFDRMKLTPPKGAKVDPRWKKVTVLQCLHHTGGWDRDKSFDPIGRPWDIAKALDLPTPVSPANVVRYMMGQPLDFDPGERHAYSNLGYLILGRLIEAVSGQKYEVYVRTKVFAPLGVKQPKLGRALVANREKNEVRYYDSQKRTGNCQYPPIRAQRVAIPDGAENLEGYEAHGGWIGSAIDLVKFASAFDDPAKCPLMRPATIEQMWARPSGAAGKDKDGKPAAAYYGGGWMVRPVAGTGKFNTWHAGFIAGTEALLVRRWDGLNWAVLFNTQSPVKGKSLSGLIDGKMHEAAGKVTKWPEIDEFQQYLK